MEEVRAKLAAYPSDRIYNMDETGFYYKLLPNRTFLLPEEIRREARGGKQYKERVTMVLCCNASGSHLLPSMMIGSAMEPRAFHSQQLPLKYAHQKNSWMDGIVFHKWWTELFLPEIKQRHFEKVVLLMDNCGSHDELKDPMVEIVYLPPCTTSVYQPLDAGIIASMKLRYKRELVRRTLDAVQILMH